MEMETHCVYSTTLAIIFDEQTYFSSVLVFSSKKTKNQDRKILTYIILFSCFHDIYKNQIFKLL